MKHKPKRSASSSKAGAQKRRRKEEDLLPDGDAADLFQASDDERDADMEEESGDESEEETAEEKKLRLGAAIWRQAHHVGGCALRRLHARCACLACEHQKACLPEHQLSC